MRTCASFGYSDDDVSVGSGDRVHVDSSGPRHSLNRPHDRTTTENFLPSAALAGSKNYLGHLFAVREFHKSIGGPVCL